MTKNIFKLCTKQANVATIRQPLPKPVMYNADRSRPWCVLCLQPNLRHHVLNRFQRRHEAEAHLKLLRQMSPTASYMVMFDSTEGIEANLEAQWQHS